VRFTSLNLQKLHSFVQLVNLKINNFVCFLSALCSAGGYSPRPGVRRCCTCSRCPWLCPCTRWWRWALTATAQSCTRCVCASAAKGRAGASPPFGSSPWSPRDTSSGSPRPSPSTTTDSECTDKNRQQAAINFFSHPTKVERKSFIYLVNTVLIRHFI